jgi:hypothetical protein
MPHYQYLADGRAVPSLAPGIGPGSSENPAATDQQLLVHSRVRQASMGAQCINGPQNAVSL